MPVHIYDPFCHHDNCAGQPKPIHCFDYHDRRGTPWFSEYMPHAWCCVECIIWDMLHAIKDEDMEQLKVIRFLIESGDALPLERTSQQSDEGDTRKEDDKVFMTEGEFTVAPTRETANAFEGAAEPVARPATAEVLAATCSATNIAIESDGLRSALPEMGKVMRF